MPLLRRAALASLLSLTLAAGGCCTLVGLSETALRPYAGARLTLAWLPQPGNNVGVILFLELPLTLCLDTALLPLALALHPDWECPGCLDWRCRGWRAEPEEQLGSGADEPG